MNVKIEPGQVSVDGEVIFSLPDLFADKTIKTVSVTRNHLYIGTAGCCHGYLYTLHTIYGKHYHLMGLYSVDTNIYDMLPVYIDYERTTRFTNSNGVIVVGEGCAGSGIRLLSALLPHSAEVLSTEEYQSYQDEYYRKTGERAGRFYPLFQVKDSQLYLRIFGPANAEVAKVEITERLHNCGVNIPETLKLLDKEKGFDTWRRG